MQLAVAVDLAELSLDPEQVKYLVGPNAQHRQVTRVAERHELLLIRELRRHRSKYLTFGYPFRPGTMAARLMNVGPAQLGASMKCKGELCLFVLIAKGLYVVAVHQMVEAKDRRRFVGVTGTRRRRKTLGRPRRLGRLLAISSGQRFSWNAGRSSPEFLLSGSRRIAHLH
jgi:hypothetical protein